MIKRFIILTIVFVVLALVIYFCVPEEYNPSMIVDLLLVFLILIYVLYTYQIAEYTKKHGEFITTPVITANVLNKGEVFGLRHVPNDKNYADIAVSIVNHTALHAEMKVKVFYEGIIQGEKFKESVKEGAFNGNEVWNIPANSHFFGHFGVNVFRNLTEINQGEVVVLNIYVETRRYSTNEDFQRNPEIQYRWKNNEKKWVPNPVSQVST